MDLTKGEDKGRIVKVSLAPIPTTTPAANPVKPAVAVVQAASAKPPLIASLTPIVPAEDLPPTVTAQPPLPEPMAPTEVRIRCVRTPEASGAPQTDPDARRQCLYVGIDWEDILRLPVRNKDERNRAISLLENLSETNCSVFTTRLLGTKATLDATRGSLRELATATSAGTAVVAPEVSATVGLLNMVGGTSLDNVSTAFYADKAAQAVTAAITAERARTQKILLDNSVSELTDYPYFRALKDWQAFDHACSMESGLEQLLAIANVEADKKVQEANSPKAEMARQYRSQVAEEKAQKKRANDLLAQVTEQTVTEKSATEQQRLKQVMDALQLQVTTSNQQIDKLGKKIESLDEPKQPNDGVKP